MNIGNIIAKWANLDPARTALVDIPNDRRVTFGELDVRVRKLANALLGMGLDKGARIGVLSKNSIEYFEIYYACARAGFIAQPLNWRLAPPELARIVEDGEPDVFVYQQEFASECAAMRELIDLPITYLSYGPGSDESFNALVKSGAGEEPAVSAGVGNDDPVLILYTGGTTGLSKGALHSHRTLYMGMLNQTVAERIVPTDVYMLTGQMFHIPVALAMNYMAHGCPVVLMNFEARQALEIIQQEKVSAFLGITTMLNWMMAVEGFDDYDLSSLRNIQYGGGPMPEDRGEGRTGSVPLHPHPGLWADRRHDHDLPVPGRSCRRRQRYPSRAAQFLRTRGLRYPRPPGGPTGQRRAQGRPHPRRNHHPVRGQHARLLA